MGLRVRCVKSLEGQTGLYHTFAPAQSGRRAIHVEAQGSLLAVASESDAVAPIGGPRGVVNGFSAASRRRLIRKLARLRPDQTVFLTLTYPARFPDAKEAKTHLRAMLERLRRRFPKMSAIWRLEFQQRGAPHFHLLCFNMPYIPHRTFRKYWSEIVWEYVDETLPFVRLEMIRSQKGAMFYAAKYCAKPTDEAVESLFNNSAYLHAGRIWGIHNKDHLPYAPKVYIVVLGASKRSLANVKKILRRTYPKITTRRSAGGCIFTDRAYSLHAALIRQLIQDCEPLPGMVDAFELGNPNETKSHLKQLSPSKQPKL